MCEFGVAKERRSAQILLCETGGFESADQPVFEGGSPWIRPHQLWTGEACLRLLRTRWGA